MRSMPKSSVFRSSGEVLVAMRVLILRRSQGDSRGADSGVSRRAVWTDTPKDRKIRPPRLVAWPDCNNQVVTSSADTPGLLPGTWCQETDLVVDLSQHLGGNLPGAFRTDGQDPFQLGAVAHVLLVLGAQRGGERLQRVGG